MRFRDDVVDGFRLTYHTSTQAKLAQPFVTFQNTGADNSPLRTIATLVAAQSALVLHPSFTAMLIAVTRTVCCYARTSTLTTCTGDS